MLEKRVEHAIRLSPLDYKKAVETASVKDEAEFGALHP